MSDSSPGPGVTPYSRTGDWFAWGCLTLTITVIILIVLSAFTGSGGRRPRATPSHSPEARTAAPVA